MKFTERIQLADRVIVRTYQARTQSDIVALRAAVKDRDAPELPPTFKRKRRK